MVCPMPDILDLDRAALERARLSRDPRFDGRFFIAVISTGIYCRPVCPARPAKTSNVRYYATAAAAAEAGFRPCLRCRPEAAPGTPAWIGTSAVVRRALRLIDDGALDEGSVEQLAAQVGVGARHLNRLFADYVGASPTAVAQTRRLHFAKRLLDETALPITQIALAAGYGSIRRFNTAFQQTYARAPRDLRKRPMTEVTDSARDEVVLRLAYRPPYPWDHVRDFFALRALPGVERVDARGYARTVVLDDGHAVVCVRPVECGDALELRVRGAPPAALFQLSSAARRAFDLSADPAAIALAFKSDPLLAPVVTKCPGMRIPGAWDPFECAVRAVLGQQVTVAAGRTLVGRLVVRAGRGVATGVEGLTHLFPTPIELEGANLDGLGITGARIRALKAMARGVIDGSIDFSLPAADVAVALASLPGFGDWTAQYVTLRALGEPDAFLSGDLVLRRMAGTDGLPLTARALETQAEAWRPWRGYAVMHLWYMAGQVAAQRGGNGATQRPPERTTQRSPERAVQQRSPGPTQQGRAVRAQRRSIVPPGTKTVGPLPQHVATVSRRRPIES
jgi:AraC family transcriptional regulator of adaptative response / DNA-3-methyladenine glycosylase II